LDNFRKQLQQLVGSIQMTNDLDVHMALLLAPSYQKHMDEKYYDNSMTTSQHCRKYTDLFGFMSKNDNALSHRRRKEPPDTDRSPATDQRSHAQPPTPTAPAPRAPAPRPSFCPAFPRRRPAPRRTETWGSKPPTFILCNRGLTKGITMNPEKTMYLTAGPDGKEKLAAGPELPSYRSRDSMFYLSWYQLWEASMPSFQDEDKLKNFLEMPAPTRGINCL
jgi:hypothetical protein